MITFLGGGPRVTRPQLFWSLRASTIEFVPGQSSIWFSHPFEKCVLAGGRGSFWGGPVLSRGYPSPEESLSHVSARDLGIWRAMSVVCCNLCVLHVRATRISPQGASARILVGSLCLLQNVHIGSPRQCYSQEFLGMRDVSFYMGMAGE